MGGGKDRSRNRKPPRDKTGRKPGKMVGRNWRSRPLRKPPGNGRIPPEAHVTGSPGKGRTLPEMRTGSLAASGGAWQHECKKCGRHPRPAASRVTSRGWGFHRRRRTQSGTKPAVATVSQCGGLFLTVSDHRNAVQRSRLRNRGTQGEVPSRGVSPAIRGPPAGGMRGPGQ